MARSNAPDGYYEQLKGGTITDVQLVEDDEYVWPTLFITLPPDAEGRTAFKIEVSRDPEGNGPGFLFIGDA